MKQAFNFYTVGASALLAVLGSGCAQAAPEVPLAQATSSLANGDYGGFYTWPEIQAKLGEWTQKYPELVTQSSLGKTVQGRDIPLLKITSPTPAKNKAEVLLLFGVHPREQAPAIGLVRLADELLGQYGRDARITKILDERTVWIVPMLNVDGKIYDMQHGNGTDKGADWRKNREPNPDGTFGIDLNRNFPVRWGGNRAFSSSWNSATNRTTGDIYEGPKPASEPETRALMDFVSQRPLHLMVDIHSPLHVLLAPSYLIAPEHARYSKLIEGMKASQKEPYPAGKLTPDTEPPLGSRGGDTGISYTWSYYTRGVYGLNIEFGYKMKAADGTPRYATGVKARYATAESVETEYFDNIRGPLLYLLEAAGELPLARPGTARLTGSQTDGPLVPGAKVLWKPKIEGDYDYAVLTSEAPEIVVNTEYRLAPMKEGFQIEVPTEAKVQTSVPLTLYIWNKKHEVVAAPVKLSIVEAAAP